MSGVLCASSTSRTRSLCRALIPVLVWGCYEFELYLEAERHHLPSLQVRLCQLRTKGTQPWLGKGDPGSIDAVPTLPLNQSEAS